MRLCWILSCLTVAAALPPRPESRHDGVIIDAGSSAQEEVVCQTEHCHRIASKIINSRDDTVNPCADFFEHVCGRWPMQNPIPANELAWSEDHILTARTYERIRDLLEEPDLPTDIEPVKKVRRFYRSCMDLEAIEAAGLQPIIDLFDQTGGWPVTMPVQTWNKRKVRWQDVNAFYTTVIGNSAFFNLEYEHNENDTSHNILTIDQDISHPMSGKKKLTKDADPLPLDFKDTYMNTIERAVIWFAKAQGYSLEKRQLAQDIIDTVMFEVELGEIVQEEKEQRKLGVDHVTMTIQELQDWYNSVNVSSPSAKIDFLEIAQKAFASINITMDGSQPIIVYNQNCLHKLARLLGKTKNRVIVNYIQWNAVHSLAFYTNAAMRELKYNLYLSAYNITEMPPRWETCVTLLEMKDAMSYMFVKRYFPDEQLEPVREMVDDIQLELEARIIRAQWIDFEMQSYMVGKLRNIVKQIGYPSWYKNKSVIIDRYKDLEIGPDFFKNVLNAFKHYLLINVKAFIEEPVRATEWLDYPITVNAFYSETTNAIIIPAAELQDPYFTDSVPDAVNYGAVGFVVGHEMSHCFDNDGISHDKEGRKVSEIPEHVLEAYKERSQCFVNQFSNYTVEIEPEYGDSVQVDGSATEDENIADSTGIQAAFAAYRRARKRRPVVNKLPGLENLSDDKLFFISFALSWCETTRPDYLESSLADDDHSPPRFRIIGSLSNMPEFAKTFNCEVGTPMNREQKCSIWS